MYKLDIASSWNSRDQRLETWKTQGRHLRQRSRSMWILLVICFHWYNWRYSSKFRSFNGLYFLNLNLGAWARHNNFTKLDEFSEQQIVDCSKSYGNEGCKGGFLDAGVTYAMDKGLESEQTYRYFAEDGHW